jgi:hypothetical protein
MWNCPLLRRNTQVLLVETKFLSLQNTRGATSGGGTVHSSEVTRRVLLVEEELSTLQK